MSSSGQHWSSSTSRGPTVTVVSQRTGVAAAGSRPPASRNRQSAKSQGLYVWIVMSLLIASTTLAVYDLYLLISALVGGA